MTPLWRFTDNELLRMLANARDDVIKFDDSICSLQAQRQPLFEKACEIAAVLRERDILNNTAGLKGEP